MKIDRMKMFLDIDIASPPVKIDYRDRVMMTGSCFTEHIGGSLEEMKFSIFQNPNGIIFDPSSVASSLLSYIDQKQYAGEELVYLNELWQSWQHHSRFSDMSREKALGQINRSQRQAHVFLKEAQWLIIPLGTAFSYRLMPGNTPVANCHRAPASFFEKHLMTIEEINTALDSCLRQVFRFNPDLRVVFTVSPVRHLRDGVIENNRSKARLLEVTHHLLREYERLYYFPAYELVVDVLRDYRFYDIDMAHPNYQATQFVIEKFMEHYVNDESRTLSREVQKITAARRHKPFQASTEAHKRFLRLHAEKTRALMEKYPFLDLKEELAYFINAAS